MPFERPSLDQLNRDAQAAIRAGLRGSEAPLRRALARVLATVLAGFTHMAFGHLDWVVRNLLPDRANREWLDRWVRLYGLSRLPGAAAAGRAVVAGLPGAILPAGSILVRGDGARYATAAELVLSGSSATVPILALVAGMAGNADAGTPLGFEVARNAIFGEASVDGAGLTGGTDEEGDEPLRERLLERLREPPQGGAAHDYRRWARLVPGVTRAWVMPRNRGVGTVDVFVAFDGRADPIPTPADLAAVQAVLDARIPVCDDCLALAPVPAPVPISIQGLNPDTPAIRAAVSAALVAAIRRDAAPGVTLRRSRLVEAAARAAGEEWHTLVQPAADVPMAPGRMAVPGAVTFAP